jgi:hypothetical protein
VRTRLAMLSLTLVLAGTVASAVAADPGGPNLQQPVALKCEGLSAPVVVNPGTLTNRGRVAWVVDSQSVFVTAYLAFTDPTGTFVLFDSKKGLKNLITCTGEGDGFTVTAVGFFTPR